MKKQRLQELAGVQLNEMASQAVSLSAQEAKLIVRALYALQDEDNFSAADRLNKRLSTAFKFELSSIERY